MKSLFLFVSLFAALLLCSAPLTEEKQLEKLPLMKWGSTVATAARGKMLTPSKGSTVCLTYPIIYDASGKPRMTSWPRCNIRLPKELRDWSRYDYLEFSVYTTFNRSDEEYLPASIGIGGVKTRTLTSHKIDNLSQNQWVKVSVPLRDMKKDELVRSMQFHLNARLYFPNDKLVLHVGDFKLVRITQWQVLGFKMTAPIIFSDRISLPVEYELLGPGSRFAVPFKIFNEKGKVIRSLVLDSKRGFEYRTLKIGKLAPGKYTVAIFPDDKQRRNETSFEVIAPPWKR